MHLKASDLCCKEDLNRQFKKTSDGFYTEVKKIEFNFEHYASLNLLENGWLRVRVRVLTTEHT
jgi:hypothetical protein